MAKKRKSNLQLLIQKRQLLERAGLAVDTPVVATADSLPSPPGIPVSAPTRARLGVTHTLGSFALILVLLAVAIYLDQKTPYLQELGEWLYATLRLKS